MKWVTVKMNVEKQSVAPNTSSKARSFPNFPLGNKKLIYLIVFLIVVILIRGDTETKVGSYSVRPSFKTAIGYDLINDYTILINEVKSNILKCLDVEDVAKCINDNTNMPDNLVLSLGSCDKGAKKIFYDFIENYDLCANTQDNDCICEFSLDFSGDYDLNEEYKIKLSKDRSIKLEEPEGTGLEYVLGNIPYSADNPSELEERDYIVYSIKYDEDGSFNSAELVLERRGSDKKWDYNRVKLYKRNDDKLVFVKEDNGKGKCVITRNIFRFCAINTEKQFYVYDPSIDKEKPTLQNPTIKFALYMDDFPPRLIENLRVDDKKKADKSVILRWSKSKEDDVDKYLIYYSKEDFKELGMQDIKGKIEPIEVDSDVGENNTFKTIDLEPSCHFENNKCVFKHDFTKIDDTREEVELKNNDAYYLTDGEEYIYVFGNIEDTEYNFAVTAVDIAGNEIDNVKEKQKLIQGKNYNQGTPKDDLAPGIVGLEEPVIKTKEGKQVIELSWTEPLKNIDGTNMDDLEEYNVYYRKNQDLVYSLKLTVKKDKTTADIDLDELDKETEYYFIVTAVDKNKNEHNDNVIMKTIKTP